MYIRMYVCMDNITIKTFLAKIIELKVWETKIKEYTIFS